jgi:hypothetical protein
MPKMVCNIYTLKKGISVESIIRSILVGKLFTYLLMKMEQTECSETSAYKIQTHGNYPEENIQHTEHGESLKSRSILILPRLAIRETSVPILNM